MPYPYDDGMRAVVTGIKSVPTVLGHAFEALRGASEGLEAPLASSRPPQAREGLREAPVASGECRCFPTLGRCPDCPGADRCGQCAVRRRLLGREVMTMADNDKCPCVTCPQSRDCADDFYCKEFETWFASQMMKWTDEGEED